MTLDLLGELIRIELRGILTTISHLLEAVSSCVRIQTGSEVEGPSKVYKDFRPYHLRTSSLHLNFSQSNVSFINVVGTVNVAKINLEVTDNVREVSYLEAVVEVTSLQKIFTVSLKLTVVKVSKMTKAGTLAAALNIGQILENSVNRHLEAIDVGTFIINFVVKLIANQGFINARTLLGRVFVNENLLKEKAAYIGCTIVLLKI